MKKLNEMELFEELLKEIEVEFSGWDFSYIFDSGRMTESPMSWNYTDIVTNAMRGSECMLDMGTGGGEYLSKLSQNPYFPEKAYATEGYKPNIPIARERLGKCGIHVYGVERDESLPIDDNMFDLIINRHESFVGKEMRRILKSGGSFITQQIGGKTDKEINEALGAPPMEYFEWELDKAVQELEGEGFEITFKKEEYNKTRFHDIGALVYYLKAIPWQVPDFTIEKYKDRLYEIHKVIQEKGCFEVTSHTFILIAKI